MADVTNISGRINSISQEGVAVVASQTLDERKNKKQSVINQETDEALANHGQHIGTLEEAVGAGGSVDERIAQAKSEAESDIKGGASSDYDTLKKTEDAIKAEVNAREEADSSLDGRMRTLEDDSVRYTPQTPSQTEQAQARTNLDTYSKAEVNQIASAFTEQNYVTVQAVAATTAADIPTLINATGDGEQTDTLYRVGWFDGTAFDVTKYSLYTWNGTAYVQMAVRSSIGEVFDISEYNATGGTPAQYETLALALGTDGANVPEGVRQGGMSVKFIQGTVSSTDNKYVQARCMAQSFTTDVTQWQSVDGEPTAGSDNLVKSGGVAASTNAEDIKISQIQTEISGTSPVSVLLYLGVRYTSGGYTTNNKFASVQKLPAGKYSFSDVPSGYEYNATYYISDSSGTNWFLNRSSAISGIAENPFVITFKRTDNTEMSDSDIQTLLAGFSITLIKDDSVYARLTQLGEDIDENENAIEALHINKIENTYNIANGERLNINYTDISVGEKIGIGFNSSTNPAYTYFQVVAYAGKTYLELLGIVEVGKSIQITIPETTTKLVFFNPDYVNIDTTVVIDIFNPNSIEYAFEEINKLNDAVFPQKEENVFVKGVDSAVLVEMYFPNLTSDWKIVGLTANETMFRLNLKDPDGNTYLFGEGSNTYSLEGKMK